jgi:glycosyltransferase involved in cell wall biosynthesis
MNVYSCLAGFLTFVPVITTFHDTVNWAQSNNLSSLLKKYILKNGATYYIAVSDYVKMLLTKKFTINANNIKTIYNGIDLNHFRCSKDKDEIRKRFGFQSSDILIAMVGNIRPAKGYEIFIQSIPEILDYYPHSKFLIVGEGKGSLLDSLISLAAKLNVTNHVHFLGFQSEIKEILEMIDIFILSSISEGLSIATIEAMAMEKPVVVSKSGGPQEIVQDGVNGLLFENGNPADLAKKVLFLLSNQSLSKTLGIKAKKTVAERFSLDKMLLEYQSVYDLYR